MHMMVASNLKSNLHRDLPTQHSSRHPQDHGRPVGLVLLYLLHCLVESSKQTTHGSKLYHHAHGTDGHTEEGNNVGVTQLSKDCHLLTKIPTWICKARTCVTHR